MLAGVFGALAPSAAVCVLLARLWPGEEGTGATIGVLLMLPLWMVAFLAVMLVPTARRAWLWCLAATVGLGALVWLLGPLPPPG